MKAQEDYLKEQSRVQNENFRELTKTVNDNYAEQKMDTAKHLQEFNCKVESIDSKMSMLEELLLKQTSLQEESLELKKLEFFVECIGCKKDFKKTGGMCLNCR